MMNPILQHDMEQKTDVAIERIRSCAPKDKPYRLAFSGGKDSQVCYRLCELAGVSFTANLRITTVDPPELIRFVHDHYPLTRFSRAPAGMFDLIAKPEHKHLFPPLRQMRWCCEELKENTPPNERIITGIRWQESARRSKRSWFEAVKRKDAASWFINCIIDWTTDDVWNFHRWQGLPHCSIYDEGRARLGCVMCPQQGMVGMRRDAERWPKLAARYKCAICEAYEERKRQGKPHSWASGEEMYEWWIGNAGATTELPDCKLPLYDN